MSSDLQWTKEKPTKPGWYWVLWGGNERPEWFDGDMFWDFHGRAHTETVTNAGPIPLPAESWDENVTNENTKRGDWIEVSDMSDCFDKPPCRRRFYLRDDNLSGAIVCYSSDGSCLVGWNHARRIREKS